MNPNLPRSEKDRLLKMMRPQQKPPDPFAEMAKRLHGEGLAGKNSKMAAETHKLLAGADQAAATAEEKRAGVGHAQDRLHLDATELGRDSRFGAHKGMAPVLTPPTGPPQGAPIGAAA